MPLKTVPVPIPLGGGLQKSKHEWRRRPPFAQQVRNLSLREGEAYQKRPGFDRVLTVFSGASSEVLVPQTGALALMNEAGAHVISNASLVPQDFGGHIPTEVIPHPIAPFRGAVSGEQIAKNGNLLAVILTEADPEAGLNAAALVVDATTYEIVAGPERVGDLRYVPRVEALGQGFVFFGMPAFTALGNDLYFMVWGPGTGFSSPSILAPGTSIVPFDGSEDKYAVYDTCPGPSDHSSVLICYRTSAPPPVLTVDLYVHRLTSGLANSRLLVGTATPGVGSDAVWYDEDSDTVLVYNGSSEVIYTNDLAFSQPNNSVAVPAAPSDVPVFYLSGTWTVLNEHPITFLGGSPRDITVGSPSGFSPILHRRPTPRGTLGSYYFADYTETAYEDNGDLLVKGRAALMASEFAQTSGGGVTESRIVVPLSEDRLPIWRMNHFRGRLLFQTVPNPGFVRAKPLGVVGQTAYTEDAIYVPHLVANAAYLPPPFQKEDDPSIGSRANFWGENDTLYFAGRTGGAGVNEGVSQLTILEIRRTTPNYSVVDYYGSTLVAAGALSTFDGVDSLPAVLDRPLAASITPNGTPAVSGAPADSYADPDYQMFLAADDAVDMKGVLVYIDRNGIKYRSDSFDLGTIENDSGVNQYYAPVFNLTLSENLTAFTLGRLRLSLEVYTNEIYTPPADPGTAFHLMFRGGVYWNGSGYIADGTSMLAPSRTLGSTDAWAFNPTPLYTSVGEELGPRTPPASNVLAQAGNYLFLLSSEDPYDIRFSKPLDDRIGPEFSPLLSLEAPPESGGVVSLAGESDRLLLLCQNGVWELFVGGGGPDSAGRGAFPPFRKVWGGEGCLTHRTTVSGMFGTFFVSDSGPKIIGRDGSVTDIGRDLGLSDLSTIRRAVYHAANQEIWLFMEGSSHVENSYVFDLTVGQWSSSSFDAKAATVRGGSIYRLSDDLKLLKMSEAAVLDGDNASQDYFLGRYVSPWLSFDSPQGYKRIRDVAVLIQLLSGTQGAIRVSLAYDYVDTNIDSKTFGSATMLGLNKPVHLSVKPSRQKCDAIRVTVEEVAETTESGQGSLTMSNLRWALADISLEVGVKSGTIKLQQEAKQ